MQYWIQFARFVACVNEIESIKEGGDEITTSEFLRDLEDDSEFWAAMLGDSQPHTENDSHLSHDSSIQNIMEIVRDKLSSVLKEQPKDTNLTITLNFSSTDLGNFTLPEKNINVSLDINPKIGCDQPSTKDASIMEKLDDDSASTYLSTDSALNKSKMTLKEGPAWHRHISGDYEQSVHESARKRLKVSNVADEIPKLTQEDCQEITQAIRIDTFVKSREFMKIDCVSIKSNTAKEWVINTALKFYKEVFGVEPLFIQTDTKQLYVDFKSLLDSFASFIQKHDSEKDLCVSEWLIVYLNLILQKFVENTAHRLLFVDDYQAKREYICAFRCGGVEDKYLGRFKSFLEEKASRNEELGNTEKDLFVDVFNRRFIPTLRAFFDHFAVDAMRSLASVKFRKILKEESAIEEIVEIIRPSLFQNNSSLSKSIYKNVRQWYIRNFNSDITHMEFCRITRFISLVTRASRNIFNATLRHKPASNQM